MTVTTRCVAALLLVWAAFASPAAAQGRRATPQEISEPFSQTVRLEQGGTFELHNVSGNVSVTGSRGRETRIEAVKRVRGLAEPRARAAMSEIRIEVAERGGNVEVRTIQPRTRFTAVDYVVTVPAGANVVLRSGSGSLRVQNVSGELRAESVSGDVTAADVRRVRALRSVTGNIDVNDCEADEFNVNTMSGNVVIQKLKGRRLDLHTTMGNARLRDITIDRAIVQSMAGNLEFAGRLARSGRYQFQTHGGHIQVTPSGNPGFDLEATTYSGDLRSDFELKDVESPAAPRPRRPRNLRGTVGNAGAVLTASTFSGNIVITKP